MVEGQALNGEPRAAVLAPEMVAQENVKTGESGRPVHRNVVFQRNHTGDRHFKRRASDHVIVFRHDVDPPLEAGLHGVLPIPK